MCILSQPLTHVQAVLVLMKQIAPTSMAQLIVNVKSDSWELDASVSNLLYGFIVDLAVD